MSEKITSCSVRMYTMGTGDCFVLFFKDDDGVIRFKMMIDCGAIYLKKSKAEKFANKIIEHTEGNVDALLVTHEHEDHVVGFEKAADIFVNQLKIKELWLPWTENEEKDLVKQWKAEYGKKKKALAIASNLLKNNLNNPLFNEIYNHGLRGEKSIEIRNHFSKTLEEFRDLNTAPLEDNDNYIGGLEGMRVVKEKMNWGQTRFLETGSIIENIEGLVNIRIHILGPPKMWRQVEKEHGKDGETYKHNKKLEIVRGFSSLPFEEDDQNSHPFEQCHIATSNSLLESIKSQYEKDSYRRIDYDWLFSAGNLSLRLTEGINNLSAVLAIEFIDSAKVMLFPGDAEFGSWESWHEITEWENKGKDGITHLTTDLLNRTVFYKVAHHMSHNGTAKEKGLDLMTSEEFVAMGTVDYNVISPNWKNTMPNRGILRDLLNKTKGKLLILNLEDMHFDKNKTIKLEDEIDNRLNQLSNKTRKEFEDNCIHEDTFIEYTVNGK